MNRLILLLSLVLFSFALNAQVNSFVAISPNPPSAPPTGAMPRIWANSTDGCLYLYRGAIWDTLTCGMYIAGSGISIVNGVITNTGDADADTTNELITSFTIINDSLYINEAGSFFGVYLGAYADTLRLNGLYGIDITQNAHNDFSVGVDCLQVDCDTTNEAITSFTINNNDLTINEANNTFTVGLGVYSDTTKISSLYGIDITQNAHNDFSVGVDCLQVDCDTTNEIQTLSFIAPNLSISDGNSVNLSGIVPPTTNTLTNPLNTITSTVNGVAASANAINSISLAKPTTNTLTVAANGVTSASATLVSNNTLTSAVNTLTSNVNGVTSTAPIINSNTLSWNNVNGLLTSTVNGVAATATIPRVSAAFPSQNGVLDTRTGAIGTAGTNIFAAHDHQHPIIALTPPTLPNLTAGGFANLVSQIVTAVRATEESATYTIFVQWVTNGVGSWATFTLPTLPGFTLTSSTSATYDPSGGVSNAMMKDGVTNYSVPASYYAQTATTGITVYSTFTLNYVLN